MDNKKFCFIMCTTNEQYANEAAYYINNLRVPEGYSVELLNIWEAASMTAGYNEGMNASDAKYKIYLHQDVFIIEPDFLFHLLKAFANPKIGMLGVVGSKTLPDNAVMWYGRRTGRFYTCDIRSFSESTLKEVEGEYESVQAIDGALMATQYDIPWREDVFKKWDFYDVSQSFEFRKHGYDVVVPHTDNSWILHDDGLLNLNNYFKEREIFLKEYHWGIYK